MLEKAIYTYNNAVTPPAEWSDSPSRGLLLTDNHYKSRIIKNRLAQICFMQFCALGEAKGMVIIMKNTSSIRSYGQVLIEPTNLFLKLHTNPNIINPIMLVVFTSLLLTLSTAKYTSEEVIYFLEMEDRFSNSVLISIVFGLIISAGMIIEWLIFTVLIYFMVALISAEVKDLRIVASIIGYSWVPIAIKTISFSLLIIFSGEMHEPRGFSIIANDSIILSSFLGNLDFFVIWQYFILFFGIRVLLNENNYFQPFVITLVTFITSNLIKILPEILFIIN